MDSVAQPFSTKSRIFNTTVWHVVDSKCRNVAGNKSANFKFVVGLKNQSGVAGEESSLQSISRTVHLLQRGGEIIVRLKRHNRRKNFLAIHFHVGFGAGQHGRLE